MASDSAGLYFKAGRTGGASWIFRYKIGGLTGNARTLATDARKLTAVGKAPLAARDAEREALQCREARRIPFTKLAADLMAEHWSDKWRLG